MRYELKKVLSNRYILLLFAALILLNVILFYCHCMDDSSGYTLVHSAQKYSVPRETLAQETAALEERALTGTFYEDDALITGNLFYELRLNREVLQQMEETENYAQFLQSTQAEMIARAESGMLGDESSFPCRAQRYAAEIYHGLEGLKPEVSFSGGITTITDWQITDLLLIVFGAAASLLLVTQERSAGLFLLLRATWRGHGALYIRKFFAMLALVTGGFLFLYGADFLLSGIFLGFGHMARPIQSVTGFINCPIPLTVIGFLMCFWGEKLLAAWAISAVIFLLCVCFDRVSIVVASAGALAVLAMNMETSANAWVRALSLIGQTRVEDRYTRCLILNFFGRLVLERNVSVFSCIAIVTSCFLIGMAVFCGKSAVPVVRRWRLDGLRVWHHTCLFRHEGHKRFVSNGVAVLLLLFIVFQVLIYRNIALPSSEFEQYYKQYSDVLSGTPTAEKDAYLEKEAAHFAEIRVEISSYYSRVEDAALAQLLTAEQTRQLRPQEAFEMARQQYTALQPGESYIYRTGYDRLFGQRGVRDDLRNLTLLMLFLTLCLSNSFAYEQETGVIMLLTATGARGRVRRCKLFYAALVVVLLLGIAFLPQYWLILQAYGLPLIDASAGSLSLAWPASWPIWTVFVFAGFLRALIAGVGAAACLVVSHKTGSTILTILICLGALVLPACISLLIW